MHLPLKQDQKNQLKLKLNKMCQQRERANARRAKVLSSQYSLRLFHLTFEPLSSTDEVTTQPISTELSWN